MWHVVGYKGRPVLRGKQEGEGEERDKWREQGQEEEGEGGKAGRFLLYLPSPLSVFSLHCNFAKKPSWLRW